MTTDRIEQAAPDVREVGLYGPNGLLARFTEMAGAIKKSAEECKAIGTSTSQAATIAALQAELAEAREVPGRIVAWLQDEAVKDAGVLRRLHAEKKLTQLMTEAWDTLIQTKTGIATAIGARDWSKP